MSKSYTCEKDQTLAMATMPMQEWCEPYDLCSALKEGTIFPCLNYTFFKAQQGDSNLKKCSNSEHPDQMDRETAMSKIMAVSFALNDLTLYLDTHPTCPEGLALFHQYTKERLDLLAAFAQKFYPLTQASIVTGKLNQNKYSWDEGPAPWEGACI